MEEVFERAVERQRGEDQPVSADPVVDLDRLAVIEAELAEAEAELDAMDNPTVDQDPGADL